MQGNIAAVVLIVVGALALAVNLDFIELDLARLLRTWWPLIPIALGVGLFFTPGEKG